MTTMIQFAHVQDSQFSSAGSFETIDACLLSGIAGGNDTTDRLGDKMETTGEYAMAAGAIGTVIPVVGETGVPEALAAAGGATWLLGKGVKAVGKLF
jgi:hypothetical protein